MICQINDFTGMDVDQDTGMVLKIVLHHIVHCTILQPEQQCLLIWFLLEEMLGTKYALWWSPNGKNIAYIEFNDTEIPVIEYSYYGENQYPRKITLPYPKVDVLCLFIFLLALSSALL